MGRKERRQMERVQKAESKYYTEKVYTRAEANMAVKQIVAKQAYEMEKSARKHAVRDLSAVLIETLRDEFGFGLSRVIKFMKRANKKLSCVSSGHVTIDDIIKQWEIELQIDQDEFYRLTEVD